MGQVLARPCHSQKPQLGGTNGWWVWLKDEEPVRPVKVKATRFCPLFVDLALNPDVTSSSKIDFQALVMGVAALGARGLE